MNLKTCLELTHEDVLVKIRKSAHFKKTSQCNNDGDDDGNTITSTNKYNTKESHSLQKTKQNRNNNNRQTKQKTP